VAVLDVMTDWKKATELAGIPEPDRLTSPLENLEAAFTRLREEVPAADVMAIRFTAQS